MISKKSEVWMYSPKHMFRILDWRWPINKIGLSDRDDVWLVKPFSPAPLFDQKDWSVALASLSEIRKHFKRIGAKGTSYPEDALEELKVLYEQKKLDLQTEAKKQAHILHLQEYGFDVPDHATMVHKGQHREAHCWRCKSPLDSDDDLACVICRWMLCECGACGCGYGRV
jgi:hypothetical protein